MSYPKISVQVATDFFSKIGGDFSFDILTRKYKVRIAGKEVSAPTIYEVFMSGAELVSELINDAQDLPVRLMNQETSEVSDEAA
ncbi:hypothetical protein [Mastigocoleus testarum]|uniref:Uncharacterized protein n=1 Tax=Mastigocoleus testarum BC008 TaxID=371196 RepID=A0A0V7ZG72_9CYAN|nr:hypothetical protein [Mastigocoleus testarum]KST63517.1 hypothetical protein BC008_13720 [Mastigocoleus testarum BC008]